VKQKFPASIFSCVGARNFDGPPAMIAPKHAWLGVIPFSNTGRFFLRFSFQLNDDRFPFSCSSINALLGFSARVPADGRVAACK